MDRLNLAVLLLAVVLLAGCDSGSDRPERLLYGQAAQEFSPVPGSVIALGRVLDGTTLGGRFTSCRPAGAGIKKRRRGRGADRRLRRKPDVRRRRPQDAVRV